MFSDKRYIVYVYVYQKQVVYAHIRKVKFPKTIRHTSEELRICKVMGPSCLLARTLALLPLLSEHSHYIWQL